MSKYLARLNAIIQEKPLPHQVPKVPEAHFGTFGTDPSRHVSGNYKRPEPDEAESTATSRPHPRIVREPPFGSDAAPARYRAAWDGLLSQCPPRVKPAVWEAAIFDAATLFGDFGKLLEDYRWTPGNLFDVPYDGKQGGLAWFIKGSPVVAIGRAMVQCQDGRIWRRAAQ